MEVIKSKKKVNPNPLPNSRRSIKRRNRGFVSLSVSSRKHRRANKRLAISQTIAGVRYPAGTDVDFELSTYHSGGRLNYW